MTFIEQFELQLAGMMETEADVSRIVRWASEKVLESYRNGITAGRNGETVKRKGKSRRRSALGGRPSAVTATAGGAQ